MILNFKTKFPWGTPTYFKEKILGLPGFKLKVTSIREGHRWKAGDVIHSSTGARTKNYECFKKGVCIATQNIVIEKIGSFFYRVCISNRLIFQGESSNLLNIDFIIPIFSKIPINDGFDYPIDFFRFFEAVYFKKGNTVFKGQIIHWTNLKY
jgi:hypothetical protein